MLIAGAIANAPKPAKSQTEKPKVEDKNAPPWELLRMENRALGGVFGGDAEDGVEAFKAFCLDVTANKTASKLMSLHGYTKERLIDVIHRHRDWLKANGWSGDYAAMGLA
jgi:hypothetical protein